VVTPSVVLGADVKILNKFFRIVGIIVVAAIGAVLVLNFGLFAVGFVGAFVVSFLAAFLSTGGILALALLIVFVLVLRAILRLVSRKTRAIDES
jgi:hypothetical protein